MPVITPRSKMISVRLSEEEYAALTELCAMTGARSVSDLTRAALRSLLDGDVKRNGNVLTLEAFHKQISSLDQKLEQLAANLGFRESGRTH